MTKRLFIVVLTYIVPISKIDACRTEHLIFLDSQYRDDILIASGPQEPRTGGILIAKAESKAVLQTILQQDPFARDGLAEYQIYEFRPTKHNVAFQALLSA